MATCFVIQRFDGGVFDKRYNDVFKPAIIAAELEPYRVDQDPSVEIPVEDMEPVIATGLGELAIGLELPAAGGKLLWVLQDVAPGAAGVGRGGQSPPTPHSPPSSPQP